MPERLPTDPNDDELDRVIRAHHERLESTATPDPAWAASLEQHLADLPTGSGQAWYLPAAAVILGAALLGGAVAGGIFIAREGQTNPTPTPEAMNSSPTPSAESLSPSPTPRATATPAATSSPVAAIGGDWEQLEPLPEQTSGRELTAVRVGDRVFVFGAQTRSGGAVNPPAGVQPTTLVYDVPSDAWTFATSLDGYHEAALSNNGWIYVFYADNGTTAATPYDPATDEWQVESTRSATLSRVVDVSATEDGRIYAIGETGEFWNFGANDQGWRQLASAPRAAERLAAGGDGLIYAVGGGAEAILVYDPGTDSWSAGPDWPRPRTMASMVLGPDGRVYVVGGIERDGAISTHVDIFDPALGAWAAAPDMPTPRHGAGVTSTRDGRLLVIGGMRDDNRLFECTPGGTCTTPLWTEVEAFTPDG